MTGASWRHFPGIPSQYMSGFMRTVTDLGQDFFACLAAIAGKKAFAVLEKPRGFPSRRAGEDSPGVWLPAGTKGRAQSLSPGGWGGSQREAFCSANRLIFFTAFDSHALQA